MRWQWTRFFDYVYKLMTKREQEVIRAIRREYETAVRDLIGQIGVIYSRLGKDGKIGYADIKSYRELQRLKQTAMAQANRLGRYNRTVIGKLLEDSYELSYDWMSFGIENAIDKTLANKTPRMPELLAIMEDNPVYGLRLDKSLESSRAKIVADINRSIQNGLVAGYTFQEMAEEIQTVFTMDYNRAKVITQTESHRVREKANNDSAQNADAQGILMVKYWMNMGDEKVRHTGKANHIVLEGQKRQLNEPFDLLHGVRAQMPGHSGTPQNDINCRCVARYEVAGVKQIDFKTGQENLTRDFNKWKEGAV